MSFSLQFRNQIRPSQLFSTFLLTLLCSCLIVPAAFADLDLNLPAPTKVKPISRPMQPVTLKAVTVDPKDPFLFDFLVDKGDTGLEGEALEAETQTLVKYFLAALTIPESDLWVNLSPYEKDAMVPQALGITELGKDLLVDDYMLKQVTAGLTNPNTETGKKFWDTAYARAQEMFGTTKVPINTFSKVWIVPDQAVVLEKDGSAFIADSHLKVFLDEDYLAVKNNLNNKEIGTDKIGADKTERINKLSSQLIKEIVLPVIEKEVNTGENFAKVRQVYSSAILAAWYKKRLKESILGQLYADKNKVAGVNNDDFTTGDQIFAKYTAALKTGVYNIIKQDYDLSSQKTLQRKYFSGGVKMSPSASTSVREMTPQAVASLSPRASSALTAAINAMSAPQISATGSSTSNLVHAQVRFTNSASSSVTRVNDQLQGGSTFAQDASSLQAFVNSNSTASPTIIPVDEQIVQGLRNTSAADLERQLANSDRDLARQVLQAKRDLDEAVNKQPTSPVRELASKIAAIQIALPVIRQDNSIQSFVQSNGLATIAIQNTDVSTQAVRENVKNPQIADRIISEINQFKGTPVANITPSSLTAAPELVREISQNTPLRTALASSASSSLSLKDIEREHLAVVSYVLTAKPEELAAALNTSPIVQLRESNTKLPLVTALKDIAQKNPGAFSDSTRLMKALNRAITPNTPIAVNDIIGFGTAANITHIASLQNNSITQDGVSLAEKDREARINVLAPVIYTAFAKKAPEGLGFESFRLQLSMAMKDPDSLKKPTATQSLPELRAALNSKDVRDVLASFGVSQSKSSSSAVAAASFQPVLESIRTSTPEQVQQRLAPLVKANTSPALVAEFANGLVQLSKLYQGGDTSLATMTVPQVREALQQKAGVSADAARLYTQQTGGIDLSADKMGLQIKRDGNGVPLAFPMQDVGNLKIDGLSPVILDVKPATPQNTPFLMNLVTGNKN